MKIYCKNLSSTEKNSFCDKLQLLLTCGKIKSDGDYIKVADGMIRMSNYFRVLNLLKSYNLTLEDDDAEDLADES